MTIPEYNLLMQAVRLKQVDSDYRAHQQAYLNFAVKAEKKVGKKESRPVYRNFKQFYDYEKEVDKVLKKKTKTNSRLSGFSKFLKKGE